MNREQAESNAGKKCLVIHPDARVVAVGNGPGVLKCDGQKIDAFDCVIRFNRYQLDPMKNVGSKTTIWAANSAATVPHGDQRPEKVLQIQERNVIKYEPEVNYLMPSWFREKIDRQVNDRARWMGGLQDHHNLLTKATCGLLVVAWLLQIAGVKKVSLAGFDHFDAALPNHYWDDPSLTRSFDPFHDGAVEAAMFAELKACGRVEYL